MVIRYFVNESDDCAVQLLEFYIKFSKRKKHGSKTKNDKNGS